MPSVSTADRGCDVTSVPFRDGLGEQRGQLLVGPKRGELNTGGMEFLKRRLIPHEVELADAIVGER